MTKTISILSRVAVAQATAPLTAQASGFPVLSHQSALPTKDISPSELLTLSAPALFLNSTIIVAPKIEETKAPKPEPETTVALIRPSKVDHGSRTSSLRTRAAGTTSELGLPNISISLDTESSHASSTGILTAALNMFKSEESLSGATLAGDKKGGLDSTTLNEAVSQISTPTAGIQTFAASTFKTTSVPRGPFTFGSSVANKSTEAAVLASQVLGVLSLFGSPVTSIIAAATNAVPLDSKLSSIFALIEAGTPTETARSSLPGNEQSAQKSPLTESVAAETANIASLRSELASLIGTFGSGVPTQEGNAGSPKSASTSQVKVSEVIFSTNVANGTLLTSELFSVLGVSGSSQPMEVIAVASSISGPSALLSISSVTPSRNLSKFAPLAPTISIVSLENSVVSSSTGSSPVAFILPSIESIAPKIASKSSVLVESTGPPNKSTHQSLIIQVGSSIGAVHATIPQPGASVVPVASEVSSIESGLPAFNTMIPIGASSTNTQGQVQASTFATLLKESPSPTASASKATVVGQTATLPATISPLEVNHETSAIVEASSSSQGTSGIFEITTLIGATKDEGSPQSALSTPVASQATGPSGPFESVAVSNSAASTSHTVFTPIAI